MRIGDRFIFEKFGGIVRRCLATGAFRKRMGMKGKSDERDVSFPESVGLGINYASWKFRQIS